MSSPSFSIPSIFCHKNLSAFTIYQSARFPHTPPSILYASKPSQPAAIPNDPSYQSLLLAT